MGYTGLCTGCKKNTTQYLSFVKGPFTLSVRVNAAMILGLLLSLKTMESLKKSGVTAFLLIRSVSLASSRHCCGVDAGAQCKWALATTY